MSSFVLACCFLLLCAKVWECSAKTAKNARSHAMHVIKDSLKLKCLSTMLSFIAFSMHCVISDGVLNCLMLLCKNWRRGRDLNPRYNFTRILS